MKKITCPKCGFEFNENNTDNPRQKHVKKKNKIALIVIALTAIVGISVFFGTSNIRTYNKAKKLYDNKQYDLSAQLYKELNDYKDSHSLYQKSLYEYGIQMMNEGKYSKASDSFAKLKDYEDSNDLYKESYYNYGVELQNKQNYEEASKVFKSLSDYNDSNEHWMSCIYENGLSLKNKNKYAEALDYFSQVKGYKDSTENIEECNHLVEIQNDKTPPEIKGIDLDEIVEIDYLGSFNVKNYIDKRISIEDDISGKITEYEIEPSLEDICDEKGNVNTSKPGCYNFNILASDEAGNITDSVLKIRIDDTVVVSSDNPSPVIFNDYDVKLTASYFERSNMMGEKCYDMHFFIENNSDFLVEDPIYSIYVEDNPIQIMSVGASDTPIPKKKSGYSIISIADSEIFRYGVEDFEEFNCNLGVIIGGEVYECNVTIKKDMFK